MSQQYKNCATPSRSRGSFHRGRPYTDVEEDDGVPGFELKLRWRIEAVHVVAEVERLGLQAGPRPPHRPHRNTAASAAANANTDAATNAAANTNATVLEVVVVVVAVVLRVLGLGWRARAVITDIAEHRLGSAAA